MKGPNCVPKAHSSTFLKFKIPKILNIRNSDFKTFKTDVHDVSMMDFMLGKGEHETCIFCHFYGKSGATSWRYVHVNVMSHININKFKMVEQRLCS